MSSQRAKAQPLRPIRSPHNPEDPRTRWSEDTDGYRPSRALDRFVRCRDEACRFRLLAARRKRRPRSQHPVRNRWAYNIIVWKAPTGHVYVTTPAAGYSSPTSPALVPELKIANTGEEPSEIVTGARYYSAKIPGLHTGKPTHLPFSLRSCVSGVASRYGASATNSSVCRGRRPCGTDARPTAGQGRNQRCGPGKAR